jgi:F0F1-type ATP synthase assembly protein I
MDRKDEKPSTSADVSKYLGFGLTWALSTLLFLYLGTWADKWFGTKPALTVIGAFIGAAAGFYYMLHHLTGMQKENDRRKRDK